MAVPAQMKTNMVCTFLFSSVFVFKGHFDELYDQVTVAVFRNLPITEDPQSNVACETVTVTKDNMVVMTEEITAQAKIGYEMSVNGGVAKIGFASFVAEFSSVDGKGLSDKTCEVTMGINKQNPVIAGVEHAGRDELIERHFTKDRTWKGTDHAASLEPGGLKSFAVISRQPTAR